MHGATVRFMAKFSVLVFETQLLEDVWGAGGIATLIPNLPTSAREWWNSCFYCFNPNFHCAGGRWGRVLGVIRDTGNTTFRSKSKNVDI